MKWIVPVLFTPTFAALLASLAGVLLIKYRRDAPADEQFEPLFTELLEAVRKRNDAHRPWRGRYLPIRFVFLIDELDRCAPRDVVEVLRSIRTFLDVPGCVFVVAADRAVLEQDLRALPQRNPVNEEAPYYSSAAEFLDKIFQEQLALPPLRSQRRTRFAVDLTRRRPRGLWAELAAMDGGSVFDEVIYGLVPPQVQSPRRIKILLNNFAVRARGYEAIGVDWKARAGEIAKLVYLETEYPTLARELAVERRLIRWLTAGQGKNDTVGPRSLELFLFYKTDKIPQPESDQLGSTAERESQSGAIEPLLVTEKGAQERLGQEQREQLYSYLTSRRNLPDPRPDLLYREGAGEPYDLDDGDLADRLDQAAVSSPSTVDQLLQGQDLETIERALRLLVGAFDQSAIAPERANVAASLLVARRRASNEPVPVDPQVAARLALHLRTGAELDEAQLLTALRIALWAGNRFLVDSVLEDARLLVGTERVLEVARLYDHLTQSQRNEVAEAVASYFLEDRAVLYLPLSSLPERSATQLLESTFQGTVALTLGEGPAGAEELLDSISNPPRRAILYRAFRLLLATETGNGYQAVRSRAELLLGAAPQPEVALDAALYALSLAPAGDWPFWIEQVLARRNVATHLENWNERLTAGLTSMFGRLGTADEVDHERLLDLLRQLADVRPGSIDGEVAETALKAITEALGAKVGWASAESTTEEQQRLHRAISASEPAFAVPAAIRELLVSDLTTALKAAPSIPIAGRLVRAVSLARGLEPDEIELWSAPVSVDT